MKAFFTALLVGSSAAAAAQTTPAAELAPPLARQNYHRHPGEKQTGYARAVLVGNTLYISGVVAAGSTMAEQLEGVYQNLAQTLAHHGLTFQHVVKENLYATDLAAMAEQLELRRKYYNGIYPAATWVEVRRLLNPKAMIEVELTAVRP